MKKEIPRAGVVCIQRWAPSGDSLPTGSTTSCTRHEVLSAKPGATKSLACCRSELSDFHPRAFGSKKRSEETNPAAGSRNPSSFTVHEQPMMPTRP